MKKPHNPALELRNKIIEVTANHLKILTSDPYFAQAMEMFSFEDYANFSVEKLEALTPYISLNLNVLTETAGWINTKDPDKQRTIAHFVQKFVAESGNVDNTLQWIFINLQEKYSFADHQDHTNVINAFSQICRDEQNAQQAKRIATSIEQSNPLKTKSKI